MFGLGRKESWATQRPGTVAGKRTEVRVITIIGSELILSTTKNKMSLAGDKLRDHSPISNLGT